MVSTASKIPRPAPHSLWRALRHITDEDAGIRGYLTESEGYDGMMKQRFEDFVVREIDASGRVVRLTSQTLPVDPAAKAGGPPASAEDALALLKQLLGEEVDPILAAHQGSQFLVST